MKTVYLVDRTSDFSGPIPLRLAESLFPSVVRSIRDKGEKVRFHCGDTELESKSGFYVLMIQKANQSEWSKLDDQLDIECEMTSLKCVTDEKASLFSHLYSNRDTYLMKNQAFFHHPLSKHHSVANEGEWAYLLAALPMSLSSRMQKARQNKIDAMLNDILRASKTKK